MRRQRRSDEGSGDGSDPAHDLSGAAVLPVGCLSPDDCLAYLEGRADGPAAEPIHRHLDDCEECRVMMAEAVRATVAPDSGVPGRGYRTLADGERIGGRYEITRFIARGGMGEVYEAVDTTLNMRVALKTLAVTASDQGDAAEGLLREVRIARKVAHPNVCRILELGIHRRSGAESDAVPFLTMDFLAGETLAQRLARVGRVPPADALGLIRDLAAGLGAVHKAGIVHRDFKSENVFLVRNDDATERVVVMDFGLARVFEGTSARRSSNGRRMIGTPAYMAPEQLTAQPVTPATDVYALGIVAFEMLTGRLPFSGDSLAAVALSRLHQTAAPPSSLVPGLDAGWDRLLERCLERDPKRRFASIADVLVAIEAIGRGGARARGPRRLVWGGVAAVAAAAVVVVIVVVVALRGVGAPPPRVELPIFTTAQSLNESTSVASPAPAPASPTPSSGEGGAPADTPLVTTGERAHAPSPRQSASPSARLRARSPLVRGGVQATDNPVPPRAEPPVVVPSTVGGDPLAPAPRTRPRHPDDLVNPF